MMKPFFVRKPVAWLAAAFVGVLLVVAGLLQVPQGTDVLKGAGGNGTPAEDVRPAPLKKSSNNVVTTETAQEQGNVNAQQKTAAGHDTPQGIASNKQNGFFVQYRLERDRTRSQQIDLFREIVNNQNSPEETRKEAQRRLLAITQAMDTEMKLENLIKAENFKDAVVFVQDKSVTVIVETPVLTALDKDRLTSITVRATGYAQENVVIIAKV